MSWNFLKPLIIERMEAATGRSVAIEGNVTVDFLPRPAISLHEIRIGNPQWATSPQMLEAQRFSVSPSLGDLLKGEFVLDAVEITGPVLNLEQRSNAPGNWLFRYTHEKDAQQPPAADDPSTLPVTIRQLSLSDAQVNYRAPQADSPLQLTIPSLQIRRESESLNTEATLVFRERRFDLETRTDSLEALLGGAEPFGGEISIGSEDDRLESTFTLTDLPSLSSLQADTELSVAATADWAQWLGLPPVELGGLEVSTRLARDGNEWQLSEIDASALDSRITGELGVELAGEAPTLNGRLHATRIDLAAWREVLPEGEETAGISIPVLPHLRGKVALSVDRLTLEQRVLEELKAKVHLGEHSLALEPITFSVAGGRIETSAELSSNTDTLSAEAQVGLENLDMQSMGIAVESGDTEPGDILSGDVTLRLSPLEQRAAFPLDTLLANLQIDDGRFSYRNQEAGSDLDITLATGEEPPLRTSLNGSFRDKPLTMKLQGDSLSRLVAQDDDYGLEAQASSGSLQASADTTLASLLDPATIAADLMLQAPNASDLEAWLGPVLPPLPEFRLAGHLERDGKRWSATRVEGEIGGARIAGSVEVQATERPRVKADLQAGRVILARLLPDGGETNEQAAGDSMLAPLRGVDGQLELRADSLELPDGTLLQGLVLDAGLDAGRLEVDPLRFSLVGGSITSRLVMDATGQTASGSLDVVIDGLALARLADTFTPVEERLGRLYGDLHLEMSETLPVDRRNDLLLPFVGQMMLEPSTLRFDAPEAGTELTLTLETRGLEDGDRRFHVEGEGRYDGHPATLSLVGDSLLDARDLDRPYAVNLEADVVGSRIALQGPLVRPLAVQGQNLEFTLEGPNPQRLSRLLGVALPNLPPYSVSGNLELNDQRWKLDNMKGEIGGSDLDGWLSLETRPRPPRLTGELRSDSLDIADLGVIFGATQEESQDRFILPDAPFVGEGWHTLTADVSYRGKSVRAGKAPLSKVDIDFRLEDGHGRFEPISFGIGEGNIDLELDLDAGSWPPVGTMQVEMRRVDLNDVLRHWNLANQSAGIAGGRGKFWVEGRSVAQLLASADGGMLLLMTGGRLDAVLVELAGLDALQAFFSWLRGREPIPIECVYADLQARDGVAKLDTLVIDTLDTTFTAGGEVNLNTERLDISIFAHSKDPSVFSGSAPFHLGGTFDDIEPGVHGGGLGLGMRAGASVVLGALGGPIAALLPLLVVGDDPDMAYCEGLVSRSQEAIREEGGGP